MKILNKINNFLWKNIDNMHRSEIEYYTSRLCVKWIEIKFAFVFDTLVKWIKYKLCKKN